MLEQIPVNYPESAFRQFQRKLWELFSFVPGFRFRRREDHPDEPLADGEAQIYQKDAFLVLSYNDGGTRRYKFLNLEGAGNLWQHSESDSFPDAFDPFTPPLLSVTTAQFDKTEDTTLENVPGIILTIAPGTYRIEARVYLFAPGSAGGTKLSFGGTLVRNYSIIGSMRGLAAIGLQETPQTDFPVSFVANNSGVDHLLSFNGYIDVEEAGTLAVQFAQNTSHASASSIKVGSNLMAWRVP